MHHTVAETVLIQQVKLQTDIVGQGRRAGSTTMGERNR
jgi:hypothetical protein